MLLYVGQDADESTDEHEGYVAVRGADGSLSTIWAGPAHEAGVAFVPRCECGWTGSDFPPSTEGHAAARQRWHEDHLQPFLQTRPRGCRTADGPGVIIGCYVPER
ncbi:MAG: hypothetical protein GEU83_05010 [Pseudonocardiaceae bacterium]|nr:hypothetical protein [Pseudonocardiaceae bacterium]